MVHRHIRPGSAWAALLSVAVLGFSAAPAAATTLLFDQTRDAASQTLVVPTGSGASVAQDYGDRAASAAHAVQGGVFTYGESGEGFTPNVVVDYMGGGSGPGQGVSLWQDDYGDLHNVIFGAPASGQLQLQLTADAGFSAVLLGFDLAGWPNADYTIDAVRVLADGVLVFEQTQVLVQGDASGPAHTSFSFAAGLRGASLLLQISYANVPAGQHDNIGLDNLRFAQDPPPPVPEAPAWLLMAAGLALLRRRALRGPGQAARPA